MNLASFCVRRTKNIVTCKLMIFSAFLFCIACATSKNATVGTKAFVYNGKEYQIRSISSPIKAESRNELISDSFLAVDMDQDQFIDQIIQGQISVSDAQLVYDFCLSVLEKENKLRQIKPEGHSYRESDPLFEYELKSFLPEKDGSFNEFLILDKRGATNHSISIYRDFEADGILDQRIKGLLSVEEAQLKYAELINRGLKKEKLSSVDKRILVR